MIARTATLIAAAAMLGACAGPKPITFQQQQAASSANCLLGPYISNADGSLSWDQLQSGLDASFAAADVNGDGALQGMEITQLNDARTGTCDTSSLIDWSGTGRIDRKTYAARYETAFGFADRERDGLVTAVEIATAPASVNEQDKPKERLDGSGATNEAIGSLPGGAGPNRGY